MFIFLVILCLVNKSIEVRLTPGVYIQGLPNVTLYQTTRPLLFKIQVPQASRCCNSLDNESIYLCNDYRFNYFASLHDSKKARDLTQIELLLQGDGLYDYNLATRNHLTKLFTSSDDIQKLFSQINARRNISYIHTIRFDSPFPNNSSCNVNTITLENLYKYQWGKTLEEVCQTKKLKLSIVPLETLSSILSTYNLENYVLASNNFQIYYNQPVVECILSKSVGILGIHLPLIQKGLTDLALKKVLTPPFSWHEESCVVAVDNVEVAISGTSTILIPRCDPYKEQLCLVTEAHAEEVSSVACTRLLLGESSAQKLVEFCPMTCTSKNKAQGLVTPLTNQRFVLSGSPKRTSITCRNSTIPVSLPDNIGALEIFLPCECLLLDEDQRSLYANSFCVPSAIPLSVTQIIPAMWTKYPALAVPPWSQDSQNTQVFDNLKAILNPDWLEGHRYPTSEIHLYYIIPITILCTLSVTMGFVYFFRKYYCYSQRLITAAPPMSPSTPTSQPALQESTDAAYIDLSNISNAPSNQSDYLEPIRRWAYQRPLPPIPRLEQLTQPTPEVQRPVLAAAEYVPMSALPHLLSTHHN